MSQNSLLASQFTRANINHTASKLRSGMVNLYSNDTLLRMSGFDNANSKSSKSDNKPCCQTKGKSNVLLNNMGGSPIKLEADNKPCCSKGKEKSLKFENPNQHHESKSCSTGSCGCGGACGKDENKASNIKSITNEISLDNQNFGVKEYAKSLNNYTPIMRQLVILENNEIKSIVNDNIDYRKEKDDILISIGRKFNNLDSTNVLSKKINDIEIDGTKVGKVKTIKLLNGNILSSVTKNSNNKILFSIEYIKKNEGYQPNIGIDTFQKPIPLNTPLDFFNLSTFIAYNSFSVIDGNNLEKRFDESDESNEGHSSNRKNKENKLQTIDENCLECGPNENGFQITHGLYCNLPQLFNETTVTSDGRMYLTSICGSNFKLEFNIKDCCKQHDIDLWCATSRSNADIFSMSKIDDYLIRIIQLIASPMSLIGIEDLTIIAAEILNKTAKGADYKVVFCALEKALDAIRRINWWDCWIIGGLIDTVSLLIQTTVAMVGALILTKETHLFHDKCLLGLGGRNKDSCLCGGDKKTECCNGVAGANTESIENCLIEAEYVDGKPPKDAIPIPRDKYSYLKDKNGNIRYFYKKNLCEDAPGIPSCRENCPSNCILDELGGRTGDIMPIEDPMGLKRPCCNKKDNWCDPNQKGSCRKCKYTCKYDPNDGKYLGTELIENEYSKQYKCCEGSPKDIKCYPKNPNWDDNWREKRSRDYGTNKQKDNYIIKNFVFEEIIVGG